MNQKHDFYFLLTVQILFLLGLLLFAINKQIRKIAKILKIKKENFPKRLYYRLAYINKAFRKNKDNLEFAIKIMYVASNPFFAIYTIIFGNSIKKISFLKKEKIEKNKYLFKKGIMFLGTVTKIVMGLLSIFYSSIFFNIFDLCTWRNFGTLIINPFILNFSTYLFVICLFICSHSGIFTTIAICYIDKYEREELLNNIKKFLSI